MNEAIILWTMAGDCADLCNGKGVDDALTERAIAAIELGLLEDQG